MDYKQELQDIEKKVNESKIEKAKLEERLFQLNKDEKEIMEILEVEGIKDISELSNKLNQLEFEIQEGLNECKKILEQK